MHLLINLAENGHFGCDNHCPFCEWAKQDYGKYWFPSDEELDQWSGLQSLVLSGGGDPLYHFDKNKAKIKHFVDYVTARGQRAGIYTHSILTLWNNREELSRWPMFLLISINRKYTPLEKQVVEYFSQTGQLQTVSIVFNDNLDEPHWDEINQCINELRPLTRIVFREHWVYSYPDRERVRQWRTTLREKDCGFVGSANYLATHVIFEGKKTTCGEIDRTVLHIEK